MTAKIEVRIRTGRLNLSQEEFKNLQKNLENLAKTEPDQEIKKYAKRLGLPINEKHIVVTENPIIPYKVEFYHNNKEGRKPNYIGSKDYRPEDIK